MSCFEMVGDAFLSLFIFLILSLPVLMQVTAALCSPRWMWTISLNIKSPVDWNLIDFSISVAPFF